MSQTVSPGSWSARQRKERERLILHAAEELILEKGYYEMSIEDIALQVGIAKGTVYRHFPSKDELLLALLEQGLNDLVDRINAVFDMTMTPGEKLKAIMEHVYKGFITSHMHIMVEAFQNRDLRGHLLAHQEVLQAQREQLTMRISAVIAQGQATGEFDPTIPTSVVLTIFINLLSPPQIYHQLRSDDQPAPDALLAHVSRFFFKGVAADASQEKPKDI
jgi:AcrR family transcriptional regulator